MESNRRRPAGIFKARPEPSIRNLIIAEGGKAMPFKTMTALVIALILGSLAAVLLGSFWWALIVITIVIVVESIIVKDV